MEENNKNNEANKDSFKGEVVEANAQAKNGQIAKGFVTPPGVVARMYLNHFGIIFSNLAVLCVILSMSSLIGLLVSVVWILLLLAVCAITLGMVFVAVPGFGSFFNSSSSYLSNFSYFLGQNLLYAICLAVVFSVASLICLVWNKGNYNVPRIVFSSVTIAISLALVISFFTGVIN